MPLASDSLNDKAGLSRGGGGGRGKETAEWETATPTADSGRSGCAGLGPLAGRAAPAPAAWAVKIAAVPLGILLMFR